MPKLLQRLMQVCVAVALPAAPIAASEGNRTLFTTDVQPYGSIALPMEMPRPKPLLYAGIEPASLNGGPDAVYLTHSTPRYTATELQCLAEALYFEARGESREGQAAVAEVILNRVESSAFPSTVCDVVNQPMQFSYTIGGRKTIRNKSAYQRVLAVAKESLLGAPRVLTSGATYFHTPSVRPAWSYRFQRTTRIGQHIFYSAQRRLASN
ncbi:cell wall hydrolase [Paracoccus alkanivorans]|nr:cell wall hydrolase [Paracoccus alkanivorans]